MSTLLRIAICCMLFIGCKPKSSPAKPEELYDASGYLDLNSQIVIDVKDVIATPYYMYKISVVNGKRDSTMMTVKDFAAWQSIFLRHNFMAGDTGKWYKESTIFDNTTQQATVNYTTQRTDLPIKEIFVMTRPESEQMQRIFMTRQYENQDSTVLEKLGWHFGRNFFVNREVRFPGGQRRTEQHQIFWQ